MRKQYCLKDMYRFQATLEIYHDGELISSERDWTDEIDKKAMQLEKDGYTYGYTQEAADKARAEYEFVLANLIGGKDNG